jgi:hypothetical protein
VAQVTPRPYIVPVAHKWTNYTDTGLLSAKGQLTATHQTTHSDIIPIPLGQGNGLGHQVHLGTTDGQAMNDV